MMTQLRPACLSLALLLLTLSLTPVSAQTSGTEHDWSVTISPVQLVFPLVVLSAEHAVDQDAGFGGTLGVGNIDDIGVFQLGAFGNYYLTGSFDGGMLLGGRLDYVYVSQSDDGVTGSGNGISVGAYVGAKHAFGFGLTGSIYLGGGYALARASATDGRTTATASASGFGLIGDIQVGWSF